MVKYFAVYDRSREQWTVSHIVPCDKNACAYAADEDCPSMATAIQARDRWNREAKARWRREREEEKDLWPWRERVHG